MLNQIDEGTIEENNRLTLEEGICRWDSDGDVPALRVYDGKTPGGWRVELQRAYVSLAPGPADLKKGDLSAGYYGTTTLINAAELSSRLGVISGSLSDTSQSPLWHKFAYQGKTLFVASKAFRSIAWQDLYYQGLIFGTDDNGLVGEMDVSVTRTNQNRIVEIEGVNYRVRNLSNGPDNPVNPNGGPDIAAGEIKALVQPMMDGRWGSGNFPTVGIMTTNYRLNTVVQKYAPALVYPGSPLRFANGNTTNQYSWLPALELIEE